MKIIKQWQGTGELNEVDIKLSVDGGNTFPFDVAIMKNINVGGINTYNYLVPNDIQSTTCILKVTETSTKTAGFSNLFNIDVQPIPNAPSSLVGPNQVRIDNPYQRESEEIT